MSKFGNRLKAIRKDLGLTQKELSEKVNKSLSSIQKYEAGEVSIPIEVISLLSEKLNVPSSKLIDETENKYYQYDNIKNFLNFMGFTFDEIGVYLGSGQNSNFPEMDSLDFSPNFVIKNSFLEVMIDLEQLDNLKEQIESFLLFSLWKLEKDGNVLNIDAHILDREELYFSDDFINTVKEKLGFYGDDHIRPLSKLEKRVWEIYKETQNSKK
ncbi:XRE family transcriptional regulator [Fusobacterium necrophorum]|uniref:XRE family transcriptional regulator n=2 Tax=Fusobacterium necrophorum TaxID=859 RepID=A0AB73BW28_9FUSO|nr:helix-turn-helix transcriptional regulator [Fusobacterium necrophorum]AYZ73386.1 XRE family transcriptional regulator [Fusobacterium necrophorum]AZW08617.1 XRE family transcriptional regulator [Fusobacterium necrophorum subsp. necrophorum]KDE63037.1 XRE family transcriptional regulator [Fusobacterium necrophorum BL]KDE65226.1 XRE family transcriptional regulator [Fusobacterium necrophorum BFTR-1]KDE67516.1 hypothetical protein FUSO4_02990 [Fusobacterium necrophorum DJ-1]